MLRPYNLEFPSLVRRSFSRDSLFVRVPIYASKLPSTLRRLPEGLSLLKTRNRYGTATKIRSALLDGPIRLDSDLTGSRRPAFTGVSVMSTATPTDAVFLGAQERPWSRPAPSKSKARRHHVLMVLLDERQPSCVPEAAWTEGPTNVLSAQLRTGVRVRVREHAVSS